MVIHFEGNSKIVTEHNNHHNSYLFVSVLTPEEEAT